MKIIFVFLFILISAAVYCQKEISYPQVQFDSDSCCWRKCARNGEYEQGARLIVQYLTEGKPANRQALNWHAGQLFAQGQNHKMALRYLGRTTNVLHRLAGGEDGKTWNYYVNGVKAFLKRDRRKLTRIIALWNRKFPKDLNYRQLVLLSENWQKSYLEALKE